MGATGQQGGAVLKHLQEKNFTVRVLTRDPDKPEARALVGHGISVLQGDQDDVASLERAMDGVDGVFSVQNWTGGEEAEIRQGKNVVDAANRQDVAHLVYSSVAAADRNTGIPHFDSKARIEEHLQNSGLAYTVVRPAFFMENWLNFKQWIEGGTVALPLTPDKHLQMVAVDDIGAFVARVFEHPRRWHGKTEELAGDDLPMSEIAARFSIIEGKEVKYQQVPWDQFQQQAGHELTIMFRWLQDHGYTVDVSALRQEFHDLTNFERWLNTQWREKTAESRGANA
jgi:uncharacterized protein YbjT (DUF2867 family)